jgi:adenosine kinase
LVPKRAGANGLPDPKDIPAVAKVLAQQPKSNPTRDRIVIFTQGAQSTIAVRSGSPDNVKTYGL